MWKSLLPVAREARSTEPPKAAPAPAVLATAHRLRRMGREVELVCAMIEMDAATDGQPVVVSQNRQTAADLLTVLLTDEEERAAYKSFLRLTAPPPRFTAPPDEETTRVVLDRRWSQLSSGKLGQLLLSPGAIDLLAARLVESAPASWAELLSRPAAAAPPKGPSENKTEPRRGKKKPSN